MEEFQVYTDIASRTNGEIYLGVCGPVRTGKSTFIKRFMELLVLPSITDEHDRQRAVDELPQSADGKTIMTTEPKFIPKEAVGVRLMGDNEVKMRLIDWSDGGWRGADDHDAMVEGADAIYTGGRIWNAEGDPRSFHGGRCRYDRRQYYGVRQGCLSGGGGENDPRTQEHWKSFCGTG